MKIEDAHFPQETIARIRWKAPYPLIRHHFGLLTMEATLSGIAQIAKARALDIVSLGIDQHTQESFFRPERYDRARTQSRGVPVRTIEDYRALYAASRRGNFPLLQTSSSTEDFLQLAALYIGTMNIAWGDTSLFWLNAMDGRGPSDLIDSIREHQSAMRWYGARTIPVEVSEPHHWGILGAPDTVVVASAYLAAYNARACGVQDYIAQFMFKSPPELSDPMDLAKMMAIHALIEPLTKPAFRIWIQTQTSQWNSLEDPIDRSTQMMAHIALQMALRPDIIQVSSPEPEHLTTADEVIEICAMVRTAIEHALEARADLTTDPIVRARAAQLIADAGQLLDAISSLAGPGVIDPLADPGTLARAVAVGLLDSPQLRDNRFARGQMVTRIIDGACLAIDSHGHPIDERIRILKCLG